MRIAQIAPLWTPVPPDGYGGAERVVHWLTEDLVRLGHDVTLFASADSRTSARLQPVCERNLIDAMRRGEAHDYTPYAIAAFAAALARALDFDVLHAHLGAAYIPLGRLARRPVVHTVHAGLVHPDELWTLAHHPEAVVAAISRSQIAQVPEGRRRTIRVVHHGCEFPPQRLCTEPGRHLLFLGRMGPHKNPVDAIHLARAIGMPIVLVGQPQDDRERVYFESEVAPLLRARDVTYAGECGEAQKIELLRHAAALLFPIRWDEHFGLVMIEAMACGTPVLAYARGSVPEVVDPGITGCYADGYEQLLALAPGCLALDRRRVFEHARQRFDLRSMTSAYLELYQSLL